MLRAVLDANIYVSAAVRPDGPAGQLVERFTRGEFEVVLCPANVDEIRRVLDYRKVRRAVHRGFDLQGWLSGLLLLADLVADRPIPRVCTDADDDPYVAAAIEAQAPFVVTGDGAFLALEEYEGVQIVTPRTFLGLLENPRGYALRAMRKPK